MFATLFLFALEVFSQNLTYTRTHAVDSKTFLDFFEFYTYSDPTHGYVDFVGQSEALASGLVNFDNNKIYMSADLKNNYNPNGSGRKSVRVHSRQTFTYGMFIIDLEHMPTGCGTWPAFWTCGPNWPNQGEIDILEGVNREVYDTTTLHTSNGCDMSSVPLSSFTGTWATGKYGNAADDCNVNAGDQWGNQGCGIQNDDPQGSFGQPFNLMKGGVIATLWDKTGISTWWFPRSNIPSDVAARKPDPTSWGLPYARFNFGSGCPSTHFSQHQVIFDLTFCGDWAGSTFASECPDVGTSSCNQYVSQAGNMQEAYWVVNYVDIYDVGDSPSPTPGPQPGSCTSQGNDPYSTGSYVDCCSGLKACLNKWDPARDPFYVCLPPGSDCYNSEETQFEFFTRV